MSDTHTFRGYGLTPTSVTITQERYDELREAELYAIKHKSDVINNSRLKEWKEQYSELFDAICPHALFMNFTHSEVVAKAKELVAKVKELEAENNELEEGLPPV